MQTRASEDFWKQYYGGITQGDSPLVEEPSPFAQWVLAQVSKFDAGASILEVGCGNGRDSVFFARSGLRVTATDCCPQAVKLTERKLPAGSCALVAEAGALPPDVVDFAYARFVLHSMDEIEQEKLLKWVQTHVRQAFYIETRSVNDPRCGKGEKVGENAYIDTHYRRFMSLEDLRKAAMDASLAIKYGKEEPSGSGKDGAVVIRAEISKH